MTEPTGLLFLLLCLATAPGCRCNSSTGSAGHSPMAQSGALTWTIEGKETRVTNTYYLALPEGLQYTMEYEAAGGVDPSSITDQKAFEIAFPLIKYAFEQRLHERTKINKLGSGVVPVSRIGVVLFTRLNGGTQGYRVGRNLDEIQTRISQGP